MNLFLVRNFFGKYYLSHFLSYVKHFFKIIRMEEAEPIIFRLCLEIDYINVGYTE